jgi:ribosomal peptide maturation radical SAM protein 1
VDPVCYYRLIEISKRGAIRDFAFIVAVAADNLAYGIGCNVRSVSALLIVPPFAGIDRPSLACHLLQACAKQRGHAVAVFYANLSLCALIGIHRYHAICYGPTGELLGEGLFSRSAFNLCALGNRTRSLEPNLTLRSSNNQEVMSRDELLDVEEKCFSWVQTIAHELCEVDFMVAGCTTTFEQTSASVALLKAIKSIRGNTIAIIGGANCEGSMAEAVASLDPAIDYVFSGESETAFPQFLDNIKQGEVPKGRVITGAVATRLDELATPCFEEFYQQFRHFGSSGAMSEDDLWLPYESSRGCWWGQKQHCTFCGLNGVGIAFRKKHPDRVIDELKLLLANHPSTKVCMVDNIMPYEYHRTLIPRLHDELPPLHIFYEQKANLTLSQIVALKYAGVAVIQPGIEALSSTLLKRMKKGVTARQNIALLRYARSVDLYVNWNLLYGFPHDLACEYEQMLSLLPLITHLNPPVGFYHLSIDRFSPYFDHASDYGISNIRPMETYSCVFPPSVDHSMLAYHFVGDYVSDSRISTDLMDKVRSSLQNWRASWESVTSAPPVLSMTRLKPDVFLLIDTRKLPNTQQIQFLTLREAETALVGISRAEPAEVQTALENHWGVKVEDKYVPLATANWRLLAEFEDSIKHLQPGGTSPRL